MVEKLKIFLNDDNEIVEDEEVILIEIFILYNDECGFDLFYVVEYNKFLKEEVVKIYIGIDYLVYMFGFMLGFIYLGGMLEKIVIFRLESFRL